MTTPAPSQIPDPGRPGTGPPAGRPQVPPTSAAGESPPTEQPASGRTPPPHQILPSRLGGLWVALTSGALVLLLLLIFILENGHSADIAFFGVHGHLPLGVALLLAAVFGILLVVVPGGGRMLQLRRAARRHRRLDTAKPAEPAPGPDDRAVEPPA